MIDQRDVSQMSGTPVSYEQALHHARKSSDWAAIRYSSETSTYRTVRNDKPWSICPGVSDGTSGIESQSDPTSRVPKPIETASR